MGSEEEDGVIAGADSIESGGVQMMVVEQVAVSQSYYHVNIAEKSS
jgi:hypothetical protein